MNHVGDCRTAPATPGLLNSNLYPPPQCLLCSWKGQRGRNCLRISGYLSNYSDCFLWCIYYALTLSNFISNKIIQRAITNWIYLSTYIWSHGECHVTPTCASQHWLATPGQPLARLQGRKWATRRRWHFPSVPSWLSAGLVWYGQSTSQCSAVLQYCRV